ncbi:hypothetical protein QQZ08_009474 [Neonectria magnoliae]|uniref:Guanine deaminase n=1 Tax=Neonectria magnoliae TaxID=2732573 RepID=A0ABR1HMX2_9HYPO
MAQVDILEKSALVVGSDGRIKALYRDISPDDSRLQIPGAAFHQLDASSFIIPGFDDTHNHAPQCSMRGLGQGLHILDWLDQVMFPHEAHFSDSTYAGRVNENCVDSFLKQGITIASYYGSKHSGDADPCKYLQGQGPKGLCKAFVGKCNMDGNAPEPPQGLGKITQDESQLAIQAHFHKGQQEINATKELFPGFKSEADLLECGVARCPISNMAVGGSFMVASIRQSLNRNIEVGLGTDTGGRFSSSTLDAIRQAMIASNAREVLSEGKYKALTLDKFFYLAKMGGAKACYLENEIGN